MVGYQLGNAPDSNVLPSRIYDQEEAKILFKFNSNRLDLMCGTGCRADGRPRRSPVALRVNRWSWVKQFGRADLVPSSWSKIRIDDRALIRRDTRIESWSIRIRPSPKGEAPG